MIHLDEDNLIIITTSPIIGSLVKTPKNEIIGEISGVILNTITGNAHYMLLSLNKNYNKIKSKHIAISWEYLEDNPSQSQEFILDLEKINVQDLSYFNPDYLSAYSQYELIDKTHTYKEQTRHYPYYSNN